MKIKRMIALGTLFTMTFGMNVFADSNIVVMGKHMENTYYTENNTDYVPVRPVAEALGFQVEWNGEYKSISLSDMPRYVTMTVGQDGYTIARTAPMPLGAAPVIKDGVTYVPSTLFSELLNYSVEKENGDIVISEAKTENSAVVKEISDKEILVNDEKIGEVRIAIGENTSLTDNNGTAIKASDIKVGDKLTIVYSGAMTMSIPPLNNPISVVVNK